MQDKNKELELLAIQIRIRILEQLKARGFGHAGGALSIAELLAVLYGEIMRIDPQNPAWEERDYFVLSKGHAGPALYAALALKGYFDPALLKTLNRPGTILPSHPDRNKTPGVDLSTGSLGQGISQAAGLALGLRLQGKPNRVFCAIGDGEANEGQVWEAALFANQQRLDNLTVFVDYNRKQLDGYTKDICDMGDIAGKFVSFGWKCWSVDGHDVAAIRQATQEALAKQGRPHAIVLNTTKGKGVRFIEDMMLNHHINIGEADADAAIEELSLLAASVSA